MKILKRLGYLIGFLLLAIISMIICILYTITYPATLIIVFIFFGKIIDWADVVDDIMITILCDPLEWYCQKTNTYDYFHITD